MEITIEMDNPKINKHVVRLVIDRELSHSEVSEYFDIVDEVVDAESVEVLGEDAYDTLVLVYNDDGVYTYEIPVGEKVDDEESYNIAQEMADVFSDDFQIEIL